MYTFACVCVCVDLCVGGHKAAYSQQGCLLRSLPPDVILDNSTGFSITCDLNDNIAAPWPSSSSISTLSLCAPEMSLPALPTSQIKNPVHCCTEEISQGLEPV
ncbi:hypothetical protein NC652_019760 [Populus alba x Populus x berolinensis]|uniref:Uncharacterized protein n=1 Tax=Populus alba x Populus x berolinensis TaxID=444605 RepID=A0AAD6QJI7_9ROSI|nr:hypothetical protein NC652_019760 [Populus alba x Populus x berolinensis]KAJ6991493.1 hypothetical protein NC653_019617 [Populus alba x Populus x berolinensis]